jgi:hypothetical protein
VGQSFKISATEDLLAFVGLHDHLLTLEKGPREHQESQCST